MIEPMIVRLWKTVARAIPMLFGYLWSIFNGVIGVVIVLYVFSLLDGRLEFIVVSILGLMYMTILFMIKGVGKLLILHFIENIGSTLVIRSLMNDETLDAYYRPLIRSMFTKLKHETLEEFDKEPVRAYFDRKASSALKYIKIKGYISDCQAIIIELICFYQLFKNLGSPYIRFITPFIPSHLNPYF